MSLKALADAYKAEQLGLSREAIRRLGEIFPLLDLKSIDRTAPGWLLAVERATSRHYAASQSLAADLYSSVRREVGYFGRVSFVLPDMNGGKLRASLTYRGPYAAKQMLSQGALFGDVSRLLFGQTSGIALRHGKAGGRDMIAETGGRDGAATGNGWIRVTASDPCGWCAMKALTVYRSKASAESSGYHDGDCRCEAFPRIADALPEGYEAQMARFEAVYNQATVTTTNRRGVTIIDSKQTIRNMNKIMRGYTP